MKNDARFRRRRPRFGHDVPAEAEKHLRAGRSHFRSEHNLRLLSWQARQGDSQEPRRNIRRNHDGHSKDHAAKRFKRHRYVRQAGLWASADPHHGLTPHRCRHRASLSSVQFGTVGREEKNEKTLKVACAGRQNWQIKNVETGHQHIEAKVTETRRENGNVDYDLTVTLSNDFPYGKLRHFVNLVTDDKKNPKVPLLVEGDVKPDIVVNPSIVSLGTMKPGQKKTVNVVLKGKKPFEVSGVTCEKAEDVFAVRLPKAASPIHVIPLTITAPAKAGKLEEELRVKISGRKILVTFRAYGQISPGT